MKRQLLTTVTFLLALLAQAQESCAEKLYQASNLYNKGQIKEAINLVIPCVESSNPSEKWQAYHLLAMAYLANSQKAEARQSAEKMLEINPTYKPSKLKDPAELIKLLKTVKVLPKFSIGLAATIGGNITYPQVTAIYNGANYEKNYASQSSWQAGMILGYHMNEIISLYTGLIATNKKFGIDYKMDYNDFSVKERMTYLDLPLFARFSSKQVKGIRFFGDIGIYTGRMLSSQSDFTRHSNGSSETTNAYNLYSDLRRNKWEYGSLFGVGAVKKMGKVNVALDLKYYKAAFTNITNPDNRYESSYLFYQYYFLDDDIRLNNLAFSLSLFYDISYRVIKGK